MEKYKTNIALELIDDIIIQHPNTKEYIEQMAQEKCKREGMLIDMVIFVFFKQISEVKNIFTNQAFHNVFIVIWKKILLSVLYLFV